MSSGASKFRKKWNITKGRVRKAAGRGSTSTDPEDADYVAKLQKFRKMRDDYGRLLQTTTNVYHAKQELSLRNRELAIILGEITASAGDCAAGYSALSKVQSTELDITDALDVSFSSRVIDPINKLIEEEFKETNDAKHIYQNARLHYDACYNDCMRLQRKGIGGEKLDQAEDRMKDAKIELEKSKQKFVFNLNQTEIRRDDFVRDSFHKHLEALAASFNPDHAASTQKLLRSGIKIPVVMEEAANSEHQTEDVGIVEGDGSEVKTDNEILPMTAAELVGSWKVLREGDDDECIFVEVSESLHVEFSNEPDSVFWFHKNDHGLWEVDEWELQMAQPGKNYLKFAKSGHPDCVWSRQERNAQQAAEQTESSSASEPSEADTDDDDL